MAVVYLTGVLEDGTTQADGVPENPRATLTVTQGTTTQVVLRATTEGGVPLSSADGTLTLTVKKRPGDEPALVQLVGSWTPFTAPGTALFTFTATSLNGLEWGRYVYDIRITSGGGAINRLIPASPFVVAPAV